MKQLPRFFPAITEDKDRDEIVQKITYFQKVIRKKKKKDKDRELSKMYENIASHASTSESEETKKKIQVDKRTKAEIAFEKSKEKKREEQILERASKTHKERIMDFNKHLDSLTEHFDIPKVSWTK